MASINKRKVSTPVFTYEGGKASHIGFEEKLQRTVLCCLLNEDTFYEDGESIKDRIKEYMGKVSPEFAIKTLNKAKHEYHLRHTPLFMLTVLASQGKLTKELVYSTVTRVARHVPRRRQEEDASEAVAEGLGHVVRQVRRVPVR